MTRERLETYQSNKEEIQELTYKLAHLREDMVGNSVILDGRTGIPRPQAVVGVDEDLLQRRRERYQERKTALEAECEEVENYIENIADGFKPEDSADALHRRHDAAEDSQKGPHEPERGQQKG